MGMGCGIKCCTWTPICERGSLKELTLLIVAFWVLTWSMDRLKGFFSATSSERLCNPSYLEQSHSYTKVLFCETFCLSLTLGRINGFVLDRMLLLPLRCDFASSLSISFLIHMGP